MGRMHLMLPMGFGRACIQKESVETEIKAENERLQLNE